MPVAHFRDASQPGFAAGRVLLWHEAEVSRELSPAGEPPGIRHAGGEARGDQRSDTGDSREIDAGLVSSVRSEDRLVELADFAAEVQQRCDDRGKRCAHRMWQARILLFHDLLDQRTHMLGTLCYDDTEFGEVAAQGVDQGGAWAN